MSSLLADAELHSCQDFILKLSLDAGRLITDGFRQERKSFTQKTSQWDLVTETDARVEKFIISAIADKFPDHRFIGEESSTPSGPLTDGPTWMIDPIDGTMNFIHSHPYVCLSIGLLIQKTPVLGVIYNPVLNEIYTARRGGGAYRNGQPIHISQATSMPHSLLMAGFGKDLLEEKKSILGQVLQKLRGVRNNGSVALHMASVACGAADCSYDVGLHCWDMAAGTIIVREAGGVVLDIAGSDLDIMSRKFLCAASPQLAQELSEYFNNRTFQLPRD